LRKLRRPAVSLCSMLSLERQRAQACTCRGVQQKHTGRAWGLDKLTFHSIWAPRRPGDRWLCHRVTFPAARTWFAGGCAGVVVFVAKVASALSARHLRHLARGARALVLSHVGSSSTLVRRTLRYRNTFSTLRDIAGYSSILLHNVLQRLLHVFRDDEWVPLALTAPLKATNFAGRV
jgi:hypothetical protein